MAAEGWDAVQVERDGDLLYVTDRFFGLLRIVDVSEAAMAIEIAGFPVPEAVDVEVRAGRACVVGRDALEIVDVSTPAFPVPLGMGKRASWASPSKERASRDATP